MPEPLMRRVAAGLVATFTVLTVVGVVASQTASELVRSSIQVEHAYRVHRHLDALLEQLGDTGPAAGTALDGELAALHRLTVGQPRQAALVAALDSLAHADRRGRTMDDVRQIAGTLRRSEDTHLAASSRAEADAAQNGTRALVFFISVTLGMGWVAGRALLRDLGARARLGAALRTERERLAAVLAQLPTGVVVADASTGRLVFGNTRFGEIWRQPFATSDDPGGFAAGLGLAGDWPTMAGTSLAAVEGSPLERALAGGETVAGEELPFARGDGTAGFQRVHTAPVRDTHGRVIASVAVVEDVTAAHEAAVAMARSAERLGELQRVTELLGSALSVEEIGDVVIGRVTEVLGASGGALAVVDPDSGDVRVVRVVGYPDDVAATWLRRRWPAEVGLPLTDAVRSGAPMYVHSASDWMARAPELAAAHATYGYDGAAVLPCVADGRVLGAIALSFARPCALAADDTTLAETLAAQCAQALHRAQLLAGQRRARADAEAAARRIEQLQHLTERVSTALAPADVVRVVAEDLAAIVGATAATLYMLPPDATSLDPVYAWAPNHSARDDVDERVRVPPLATATGHGGAARSLPTRAELAAEAIRDDVLLVQETIDATLVALPLRAGRGPLGAITLELCPARALGADDRELLLAAGRIAAQGVTRARLQSLREEERRRLARELHDEFGQALTGLKLDLAWLGRQLGTSAPELVGDTAAMAARVDTTVDAVRRIASQLRPAVLDDLGLVAALEWQAAEFERRSGVVCELDAQLDDEAISEPTATAVFRVFQEALTNVVRHAQARRVEAAFARTDGRLTLRVRDDGVGLVAGATRRPGALGLAGMRERAAALGGEVTVRPAPGGGTLVTLVVPDPRPPAVEVATAAPGAAAPGVA